MMVHALAVIACFVINVPSAAANPNVFLLAPTTCSATLCEAILRLRAELTALRVNVTLWDSEKDGIVSREVLAANGAMAALWIEASPDGSGAQLRSLAADSGRIVTQSVDVSALRPDQAASVVAIRSLEVLRASAIVLRADAATPTITGPPLAVAPHISTEPAGTPGAISIGVSLGGALIGSSSRVGTAFMPHAQIVVTRLRWAFALSALGLGPSVRIASERGTAEVQQTLLAASVRRYFQLTNAWRLFFSLGCAELRVNVRGANAVPPYSAAETSVWSPAVLAGAGIERLLSSGLAAVLATEALFAKAAPSVLVDTDNFGQVGRPSAIATLALKVAF